MIGLLLTLVGHCCARSVAGVGTAVRVPRRGQALCSSLTSLWCPPPPRCCERTLLRPEVLGIDCAKGGHRNSCFACRANRPSLPGSCTEVCLHRLRRHCCSDSRTPTPSRIRRVVRFAEVKEEQRACPLRGTRSKTRYPPDPKASTKTSATARAKATWPNNSQIAWSAIPATEQPVASTPCTARHPIPAPPVVPRETPPHPTAVPRSRRPGVCPSWPSTPLAQPARLGTKL